MSKRPELCGCVGFLHSTVASFILSLPAAAVGSFPRLLITFQSATQVHIGRPKLFAPLGFSSSFLPILTYFP